MGLNQLTKKLIVNVIASCPINKFPKHEIKQKKKQKKIGIGNSMICSDIWHKYH